VLPITSFSVLGTMFHLYFDQFVVFLFLGSFLFWLWRGKVQNFMLCGSCI